MQTVPMSPIYELAVSPNFASSRLAFAAGQGGAKVTRDGGHHWEHLFKQVAFSPDTPATAVALSPNWEMDGTLFVAIAGGIASSNDRGVTWQIATLGLPTPIVSTIRVSPDFQHDAMVFVATLEDGVLRSNDGGKSFERSNFHLFDYNVNSLCLSTDYPQDKTLFAGSDSGIFRSRNRGKSWREMPFPLDKCPVTCMTSTDNKVYAGTALGGAYVSTNQGETWQTILQSSDDLGEVFTIYATSAGVWILNHQGIFLLNESTNQHQLTQVHQSDTVTAFALIPDEEMSVLLGHTSGHIMAYHEVQP